MIKIILGMIILLPSMVLGEGKVLDPKVDKLVLRCELPTQRTDNTTLSRNEIKHVEFFSATSTGAWKSLGKNSNNCTMPVDITKYSQGQWYFTAIVVDTGNRKSAYSTGASKGAKGVILSSPTDPRTPRHPINYTIQI